VPIASSPGRAFYLAVSPDERWLAFSTPSGPSGAALAIVPRTGGNARVLARVTDPAFVQAEAWTRDGKSVLYGKGRTVNGQSGEPVELWRVDVEDGHSEAVGLSMVGLREVRMHPDGRHLAWTAGWPVLELWVMENFLPVATKTPH
jgi:Tol biopolymer transport system component